MDKLVIFHPALAPYRIDFFNSLNETFDASFYFLHKNAFEQSFDQDLLQEKSRFLPEYLSPGFLNLKNLRLDVISILRREKPRIVFCSEYNMLGILLVFFRFFCKSKFRLFTICDDSLDIAISCKGKNRLVRNFLVRCFDGVIVSNLDVQRWYIKTFSNNTKFIYFPIIQDDERFRIELKNALSVSSLFEEQYKLKGKKILLFVGRLIPLKNVSFLIKAFGEVAASHPSAVVLIVGEGEEYSRLKGEVSRLGFEGRILFLGKKQGNELYAIYNIGQLFILPSIYEPFGAVTNEALLSGCYTLCSSVAGSVDLVKEGENGDIFCPFEIKDLTSKLDKALKAIPEYGNIEVMANRMCKSYLEYYDTLINHVRNIVG